MFHTEKDDVNLDGQLSDAEVLNNGSNEAATAGADVFCVDDNTENTDLYDGILSNGNEKDKDMINDQLIRDGQAKLESEINTRFPLISELIPIDALHQEYSMEDEVYQGKVEDLKVNYSSIRKTRPDGNCFYRAFIFSYFESLIGNEQEQQRFLELCRDTRKGILDVLGFPDFTIDEFYEYFYEIITMIVSNKISNSEQLLAELDLPAVYDNIVVYLRLLTSYYLQKESEFFTNFIEGCGPIADFCKREVEPMYKESDHIHIIALSSVFDVTVRIVYMDRGAGGKVNEHDFSSFKAEGPCKPARVHLLYRPGHYDVLYDRNTPLARPKIAENGVSSELKESVIVLREEADSSEASTSCTFNQAGPHSPQTLLSPKQRRLDSSQPSPFSSNQQDEDEANSTQPEL